MTTPTDSQGRASVKIDGQRIFVDSYGLIDQLIEAATASAGSLDRGLDDLRHVFAVPSNTLTAWTKKGIPPAYEDLALQVAQHYGLLH